MNATMVILFAVGSFVVGLICGALLGYELGSRERRPSDTEDQEDRTSSEQVLREKLEDARRQIDVERKVASRQIEQERVRARSQIEAEHEKARGELDAMLKMAQREGLISEQARRQIDVERGQARIQIDAERELARRQIEEEREKAHCQLDVLLQQARREGAISEQCRLKHSDDKEEWKCVEIEAGKWHRQEVADELDREPEAPSGSMQNPVTPIAELSRRTPEVMRRDKIRAICETRGITTLIHFTRSENLPRILADGILTRTTLERRGIRFIHNDDRRIDGHTDAVCLSISFPNYKMFYKYQEEDHSATWVVLLIKAEVLWELDCGFCWANAATSSISQLPVSLLKNPSSLEKMFNEKCPVSGTERFSCIIPDNYPTNPQAEVLAFSGVPLKYVSTVCFKDSASRSKSKLVLTPGARINVHVDPDCFVPRCDWRMW